MISTKVEKASGYESLYRKDERNYDFNGLAGIVQENSKDYAVVNLLKSREQAERKVDKGRRGKPSRTERNGGIRFEIEERGPTRERGKAQTSIYPAETQIYSHCGDDSREVPPVLIPNTEVKLSYAEST